MKKIVLTAITVMAILFTSCVEDVNPEATWTLISLDDGETTVITEDSSLQQIITLSVTQNTETEFSVSGFSGVNHFNGTVTIEKNTMTVEPLAVTMMMGADEAQKTEDSFLKVFNAGGKLTVKEIDGKTILSVKNKANGTELQFVQTLLENTAWNLSMYNVGTAVTNVPSSVAGVALAFSADGKVYGSTGVNNIMGSYEFSEDGKITFSALGTTRMAAPNQEARDFELRLLELLEQVSTFDISGQTLTLRNANGESLLVYVK